MTKWTKKRIRIAFVIVNILIGVWLVFRFLFRVNLDLVVISGLAIFVLYIGRELERYEWWDIEDEREEQLKSKKVND